MIVTIDLVEWPCSDCGRQVETADLAKLSESKFGELLCRSCYRWLYGKTMHEICT